MNLSERENNKRKAQVVAILELVCVVDSVFRTLTNVSILMCESESDRSNFQAIETTNRMLV